MILSFWQKIDAAYYHLTISEGKKDVFVGKSDSFADSRWRD